MRKDFIYLFHEKCYRTGTKRGTRRWRENFLLANFVGVADRLIAAYDWSIEASSAQDGMRLVSEIHFKTKFRFLLVCKFFSANAPETTWKRS